LGTARENYYGFGEMIYFLLIFQQFLASTTHIFAKNLTFDLPPTLVLFFRSLFASIMFVLILLIRKQNIFAIKKKDVPKFFILGALSIPLNQLLFFVSIKLTTAPNVALAYALSPIFILIIAVIFLKEKATLRKIIGIVVAFVGIGLILIEKGVSLKSEYFLGNLIALVASLSWAFYTTYGKPLIREYGSIYTTAISMVLGFLLYLPISIAVGDISYVGMIQTTHWLQIVYLAVMTSGLSYLLWYYALKRMSASSLGVFNNLQPVFTTILSVIFFKQVLTSIYLLGGLLVIVGVILAQINHVDEESRRE
ncbi:MAG: DMT family transporter, partial [Candidatus Kapaibacteriota bacterium]